MASRSPLLDLGNSPAQRSLARRKHREFWKASLALCGLLSAAAFLNPATVFAQGDSTKAPAVVEQVLRGRVNEFFQDFVDRKFRAAINFVAEDTQDFYFSSPKAEITSFKIDGIKYADDFTKATVSLTTRQILHLRAEGFVQDTEVPKEMETNWKVEDGKWVFYDKPKCRGWLTPMGPSSDVCAAGEAARKEKKEINDGTMASEAQRILDATGKGTGVTPSEVTFPVDKASSTTLTFHNGVPGSVSISVEGLPTDVEGLTFKVAQTNVNSGADGTIEFQYKPSAGAETRDLIAHLVVQPFGMEFPIRIHLTKP